MLGSEFIGRVIRTMGNIKTGNGILGTPRRVQASVLVGEDEDGGAVVKKGNQRPKGRGSGLFSYLPSINLQLGSLIPDLSEGEQLVWLPISPLMWIHFPGSLDAC